MTFDPDSFIDSGADLTHHASVLTFDPDSFIDSGADLGVGDAKADFGPIFRLGGNVGLKIKRKYLRLNQDVLHVLSSDIIFGVHLHSSIVLCFYVSCRM